MPEVHKLTIRWPSGIVEEHLFSYASYAHGSYHRLKESLPSSAQPAFKVEPVQVHDNIVDLRATLQKV